MADVKVSGLTKKYGKATAVNNVSFSCKDGEFFSILGPSGAGKTTTLELIAGIKTPDAGEIYIGDRLVNELSPQNRDVAMAYENYSLYPHFTVYENLEFPLKAPSQKDKLSAQQIKERVEEIAELLGIRDYLNRGVSQLSGGQKQRVSLGRAMVRRPQVYLLDEPIAHLDAKLKAAARTSLKRIANKLGITIIYVTHDYKEALALSDRILILSNGTVQQVGNPIEVYKNPASDFVAKLLGDPPCNLIDTEIVRQDGKVYADVTGYFRILINPDLHGKLDQVAWQEGGKTCVRIGVRPQHIRVTSEKVSENSFQLPVFSIVHETKKSVVTFKLKDTFLIAKTEGKLDFPIDQKIWITLNQENMHFFKRTVSLNIK